jgi:hypothetical protein
MRTAFIFFFLTCAAVRGFSFAGQEERDCLMVMVRWEKWKRE